MEELTVEVFGVRLHVVCFKQRRREYVVTRYLYRTNGCDNGYRVEWEVVHQARSRNRWSADCGVSNRHVLRFRSTTVERGAYVVDFSDWSWCGVGFGISGHSSFEEWWHSPKSPFCSWLFYYIPLCCFVLFVKRSGERMHYGRFHWNRPMLFIHTWPCGFNILVFE